MFKVGQKVVCVDGSRKPDRREPDGYKALFPKKGEIYTVREILQSFDGSYCVRLEEIVNKPAPLINSVIMKYGMWEPAFRVFRFRPIDNTYGEQVCEELERITEPELV